MELNEKPPLFREGQSSISADALNKVIESIPRLITGDGVQIKRYGDRIVVQNDQENAQPPSPIRRFVVLQELEDVLLCIEADAILSIEAYDASLGWTLNNNGESGTLLYVAKPTWLQKSTYDTAAVDQYGSNQTIDYTTLGHREVTESGKTVEEIIYPAYFPGCVISAREGPTGYETSTSEATYPILWTDLNEDARIWANRLDCCPAQDIETYPGSISASPPFSLTWETNCAVWALIELTGCGGGVTGEGTAVDDHPTGYASGGSGGGAYSASLLYLLPGKYTLDSQPGYIQFLDLDGTTVLVKSVPGGDASIRGKEEGPGVINGGLGGLAADCIGQIKRSGGNGGKGIIGATTYHGSGTGGGAGGRYGNGLTPPDLADGDVSPASGSDSGGTIAFNTTAPGYGFFDIGAGTWGDNSEIFGFTVQDTVGGGVSRFFGGHDPGIHGAATYAQVRITIRSALDNINTLLARPLPNPIDATDVTYTPTTPGDWP